MKSIWENEALKYETRKLDKNLSVDTLIVGGGICGVLCAYYLTKKNINCVLIEKNDLGSGITKNTTAVVSAQQEILYKDRIEKIGKEKAKRHLDANLYAIQLFKKLSEEYDFDFEEISNFIYNKNNDKRLFDEYLTLKDLGYKAFYSNESHLKFELSEILEYKNQAQINPLKLIYELSKEINYYNNTEIVDIVANKAHTEGYEIQFKNVVICTHFPQLKIKGLFSLKMKQEKSFVMSIKCDDELKDSYVGLYDNDLYFRRYKDNLIIGANDIQTGCINEQFKTIEEYIKNNYQNYEVTNKWINQDCITIDDLPYIGRYSSKNNYYIATGFNMWGMTSSILAADIISDLICNERNRFIELYNPKRKIYVKGMFKNILNAIKHVCKFSKKRCPHLGSTLNYIKEDESYECPCHGSKFDKDGKLIYTPAKKDIK